MRYPAFSNHEYAEWSHPDAASDGYRLLAELGSDAGRALYAEDRKLRRALDGDAYAHAGRGLTFWQYETTLMYVVFRAAAPHGHADWDWGRARSHLDLVITPTALPEQWGFESSWWLDRTADPLEHDRDRLLAWSNDGNGLTRRGLLIAFWWTTASSHERELRDADRYFREHSAPLQFRASFPTEGAAIEPGSTLREPRRFFMDILLVTGPAADGASWAPAR